jgi:hypothetical protein
MMMQLTPFIYKLVFIVFISLGLSSYTISTWKQAKKNWIHLKRLHQIPCSNCVFFTGEYNLKCTVHPCNALSEEAIGCKDYERAKDTKR